MVVYIHSEKPLTLAAIAEPWLRLFEGSGPGFRREGVERVLRLAADLVGGGDDAFWQREREALAALARTPGATSGELAVGPLVVPARIPARWMPLLEGWSVLAWTDEPHPLSPYALLWLKEMGAVPGRPPAGRVLRVQQGDGLSIAVLLAESGVPACRERGEHGEEHVDEGMVMIQANLDDASPEWIAYAMDRLLQAGANDVSVLPMTMKKSRSGLMLQVLCYESAVEALKEIIFRETTTFGLRYFPVACHRLARRFLRVQTEWGEVTVKVGYHKGERVQVAPEYEACARLAREQGVPLREVYRAAAERAARQAPARLES